MQLQKAVAELEADGGVPVRRSLWLNLPRTPVIMLHKSICSLLKWGET